MLYSLPSSRQNKLLSVLKTIRNIGTRGKLAGALILLVLLPAIFYSAYEFSSLSRSEGLIGEIYAQQLEVVLFSLNQYAWDVANSWANTINGELRNAGNTHHDYHAILAPFLKENAGIQCLFVTDSLLAPPHMIFHETTARQHFDSHTLTGTLRSNMDAVQRLYKLQTSGYRKISSVTVADSAGVQSLALLFVGNRPDNSRLVIGIVLDAERFIREVLGQKMNEAAGDNFLVSVIKKGSDRPVYGTIAPAEVRQTKELWLFPDYVVGIRLRGQTIAEVVQERFYRNMILIGLLDVILIAGAWFIYRTVRREMELAQLKSDFVSNVSHELKTPLALIRMFGETLQMKRVPSEEKKQEYYDTIVQESERLTRLVNNVLSFSRMEAGKKEYRFVNTDLNTVVQKVVKSYEAHLVHQGFQLSTTVHDQPCIIGADPEAVSEALLNIIDNAAKYSDKEKSIRIFTGMVNSTAYIEVEDHGIGIAPKDQKMIFDKFHRVSSGLVHNTKGSGLGLTLVRHIMDAHKGIVTVKSEPGKGSTFRLSFPLKDNA